MLVVSPGYLKENNIPFPAKFELNDRETVVFVISDNQLAGYIALSDHQPKPQTGCWEASSMLLSSGPHREFPDAFPPGAQKIETP